MIGYRQMYAVTDGAALRGDRKVTDQELVNAGFSSRADGMVMHMAMFDIMYAPTDWLSLMLMPQLSYMDMKMKTLPGGAGGHSGHGTSSAHEHQTAGIGDTAATALVRLMQVGRHHLHAGLGISVPTGSTFERDGRAMQHYGMQLGSGTWDVLPSLTYTGGLERWGWGGQVSGTKRLFAANAAGYRLGDQVQTTGWGSYRWFDWLSSSLRFQYAVQEKIDSHFNQSHNHGSPPDFQANYGGHYVDAGFGLNMVATEGALKGVRFGAEWLQPLYESVNGTQQERTGTLYLSVSKSL